MHPHFKCSIVAHEASDCHSYKLSEVFIFSPLKILVNSTARAYNHSKILSLQGK